MLLTNFYNQNHKNHLHFSDFWLYELSMWLHVIAYSLVAVFVPILLYKLGFTIGEIAIYYTIYNFIDVPFNFVARTFIVRFGARLSVALGTIFAVSFFLLFSFLEPANWTVLFAMAVFAALYDSFYWVGHVYLFINSTGKDKDAGAKTGTVYIVRKFGAVVAPLIGAAILIFGDRAILMYASIIIFLTSLVPLIWLDNFEDKPKKKLLSFKEFFKKPNEKKNYLTTGLFAVHSAAESVIWPLFIFTVFGNLESVAFIPLIIGSSTMFLTYFVSHIKKGRRELMIITGALMIALMWLARLFVDADFVYLFSVFVVGAFTLLVTIPLDSNLFTRAKELGALEASTYRNAANMFTKFVLYGVLALMLNIFHVSFLFSIVCLMLIIAVNYTFLYFVKGSN